MAGRFRQNSFASVLQRDHRRVFCRNWAVSTRRFLWCGPAKLIIWRSGKLKLSEVMLWWISCRGSDPALTLSISTVGILGLWLWPSGRILTWWIQDSCFWCFSNRKQTLNTIELEHIGTQLHKVVRFRGASAVSDKEALPHTWDVEGSHVFKQRNNSSTLLELDFDFGADYILVIHHIHPLCGLHGFNQ